MEVGAEGGYIPIATLSPPNDSCIKMGSDESHFNVSVGSDGQGHQTVSTNHNLFEEKEELKQYQPNALLLGQTGAHLPRSCHYLTFCILSD